MVICVFVGKEIPPLAKHKWFLHVAPVRLSVRIPDSKSVLLPQLALKKQNTPAKSRTSSDIALEKPYLGSPEE